MAHQTSIESLQNYLSSADIFTSHSCDIYELKEESEAVNHSNQGLFGWWFAVSKDGKDPFGHIIEITADHGRYLARSYSPWQLQKGRKGTPLFEICGMGTKEGEQQKAFYLNHKDKASAQNGKDVDYEPVVKEPHSAVFLITPTAETDRDNVVGALANLIASNSSNSANPVMEKLCSDLHIDPKILKNIATNSGSGDLHGKEKAIVSLEFAVGMFKNKPKKYKKTESNKKKKNMGMLETRSCRVPVVLERKGCFSFNVTVEEDKEQQFGKSIAGYHSVDHVILDIAESMGKGKHEKNEDKGKEWPLLCSKAVNQAINQRPVLSGLTTFKKISVTASLDPLNGLYISSNGYFVSEVFYFTRKFGKWQEDGDMQEPLEIEPYDYVEAVKLIGDPIVPAGQVAFRAKVGGENKLPPRPVLEKELGAVARYLGRGRLTGFHQSKWVDVEVHILGPKYQEDGYIGLLYSAPEYYVLKLAKQLSLPGIQKLD